MLTGLVIVAPVALALASPRASTALPSAGSWSPALPTSAALLLIYTGFRMGGVGVVAPISSAEGAVAAVIAVAAGESLGAGTALALVAIVAGVVMVASAHAHVPDLDHVDPRAALFGLAAAGAFGTGLYATVAPASICRSRGRSCRRDCSASHSSFSRCCSRAASGLTRAALPFVVGSGLAEVTGFICYAIGARHGIAVTAVLASQFAALAAIAAAVLFGERLGRLGVIGYRRDRIGVGVAVVSALSA